jgi:ABC-type branched-subunit amino acid transport system substrate-binding protein
MQQSRSFPPGMGWIPLTVAVAVAGLAAVTGVVPQFQTQTVGLVNNSAGGGPAASTGQSSSGGQGGTGATQGHYVGGTQGSSGSSGTGSSGPSTCAAGHNGGHTAPGVTATEIHIATTEVTTGVGSGFLGQAVEGMEAAIDQVNGAGGICGRRIVLDHVNDGWQGSTGATDISNYINSGNVFSLVAEPDSEGLSAAILSNTIDNAGIPVVGTDGMLVDQYYDPWVWPVAASTVTNMHIAADYAYNVLKARSFGIVYDTSYKFGREGAEAFDNEIKRLSGSGIPGDDGQGCSQRYCGVTSDNTNYHNDITTLNNACSPCDVVMMLLEPGPMEAWMNQEKNATTAWYKNLMGGEPLFDDNLGSNCSTCGNMIVWTGYHPDIQPFDSEKSVYTFAHALHARCPSCDSHNEFTEGAYLGTQLFIAACEKVGANLTRTALRDALNSMTFASGLAQPLAYSGFPRVANAQMAAFSDNSSGNATTGESFNGWTYMSTGFLADPARGQDMANPRTQ